MGTRSDVGAPKVDAMERRFKEIMPECEIEACREMYTAESEEKLLAGEPSFVLDCIDNIDTKVQCVG